MKRHLDKLPEEKKQIISAFSAIAASRGISIYLVGGFVRDLLLGRINLDLDIVAERDGISLAEEFAARLKAKAVFHKRFGTATIIVPGSGFKVDITTARSESYPYPASLPVVRRGNLKEDLFRRDFTINSMAICISQGEFGKLIDYYGGQKDLRDKKVRVLHKVSFIDDPTRILRAIRFEQRFGFSIEPETRILLRDAVKLKMLEATQPQRLRDEIILMLKEENCLKQLRRMDKLVGFRSIHNKLELKKKDYQLISSMQKEVSWYNKLYPDRRILDSWLIYFMAVVDPLNLKQAKEVTDRMVLKKGEDKRIFSYKSLFVKVERALSKDRISPLMIFRLLEPLSYETIIAFRAKTANAKVKSKIRDFFDIYNGMRLYVSGHDLHKLGLSPSPLYQKIFSRVLAAKINGKIRTREQELGLIRKYLRLGL
ncbi:MAG: CCA tRNA nucleotidyltransferase [Candidatus Omnitrophota bacterium]|jgi:tRNA nucleotidyltransferase (CCA-adding enzyme)|nr:MAG: CCA tRNA nucleotidyltransferase [Candidatus Omnitrophota bacterium]